MAQPDSTTIVGTSAGTISGIIFAGVPYGDIVISAIIGAAVGFLTTELLKYLKRKFIDKRTNQLDKNE